MPVPTPTPPPGMIFFNGKGLSLFLKPDPTLTPTSIGATPLPTPTPVPIDNNFSVTSYSANNDWRTYFPSPVLGFSPCSGCGLGSTEVVRIQGKQLYESSFNVTVAGQGTPTYSWELRVDNGSFWSGWIITEESFEFKDVTTSSLKWRYQGIMQDRKIALRCRINNSFVTKPIYYRYFAIPGDIGYPPQATPEPSATPAPTPPPTYGL